MSRKDNIIDNIIEYSAPQIVAELINKVITIPEILSENPIEFSNTIRKEVENILWDKVKESEDIDLIDTYLLNYPTGKFVSVANKIKDSLLSSNLSQNQTEELSNYVKDEWDSIDKGSIFELQDFITKYPDSSHLREARKLITEIKRKSGRPKGKEWLRAEIIKTGNNSGRLADLVKMAFDNDQITMSEFVHLIEEDPNILPLGSIKDLIDKGYITTYDLESANIDKDFNDIADGIYYGLIDGHLDVTGMVNPTKINQTCQEIYFWGMPSSGKTCALGAILSAASTGKVAKTLEKNTECCGIDYMRQLSSIFTPNKITKLPTGTSADFVSDMSFWLLDKKNRLHSLTLIDLAGEMLHAMYLKNIGREDDMTPDQVLGYESMYNLLVDKASKNSKIHFFVLEYGGHERKEKGIRQIDMLDGALAHIKKLGILERTDAVFILLTKADKALNEPGDIQLVLENYVKTYYESFYNNLKLNTTKINGGKIEMFPFSIGEVCFKDLCRFDDETANEIVQLFLERTVPEGTGKINKWINKNLKK